MDQTPQDIRRFTAAMGKRAPDSFSEPWQARAFALVLALSERGLFSLQDFQSALIARVSAFEKTGCIAGGGDYYTCWLEALEELLTQRRLLVRDVIDTQEDEVIFDAASRKAHQVAASRDESGHLKIAPIYIDDGAR